MYFVRIQRYSGKLTADSSNVNRKSSSPKRKVKRTKKVLTIDEEFQSKRPRDLQSLSTLFENKEFCVLTDANNSYTKNELEKKILQHGGTIVQNPGDYLHLLVDSLRKSRLAFGGAKGRNLSFIITKYPYDQV